MLKSDSLSRNLSDLVQTTHTLLDKNAPKLGEEAVMDPFDDIYRVVYALTMRTVGTTEIVRSPELMDKTLGWFETLQNASAWKIIFPWLPTLTDVSRMIAGGRLYYLLKGFVDDRKRTGRREDDALQYLLDMGNDDMQKIIAVSL
jgi:sterol 14-demethylase